MKFVNLSGDFFGNDTIDHSPLWKYLGVSKLLCFNLSCYRELVKLVQRWKSSFFGELPEAPQKIRHYNTGANAAVITRCFSYEATNIWPTRESTYWQWIRVREWFREHKEKYEVIK